MGEAHKQYERETNKTLKRYYMGIIGFIHCFQDMKIQDLSILKFLLSCGIFSCNCSSALGFKDVGQSFIHFTRPSLKILWGVKEEMCEKSLARCLAQSTSKNQQRYLLKLFFFYFYLYHNLLKVYLCYLVLTFLHNNKGIVVAILFHNLLVSLQRVKLET